MIKYTEVIKKNNKAKEDEIKRLHSELELIKSAFSETESNILVKKTPEYNFTSTENNIFVQQRPE